MGTPGHANRTWLPARLSPNHFVLNSRSISSHASTLRSWSTCQLDWEVNTSYVDFFWKTSGKSSSAITIYYNTIPRGRSQCPTYSFLNTLMSLRAWSLTTSIYGLHRHTQKEKGGIWSISGLETGDNLSRSWLLFQTSWSTFPFHWWTVDLSGLRSLTDSRYQKEDMLAIRELITISKDTLRHLTWCHWNFIPPGGFHVTYQSIYQIFINARTLGAPITFGCCWLTLDWTRVVAGSSALKRVCSILATISNLPITLEMLTISLDFDCEESTMLVRRP